MALRPQTQDPQSRLGNTHQTTRARGWVIAGGARPAGEGGVEADALFHTLHAQRREVSAPDLPPDLHALCRDRLLRAGSHVSTARGRHR
eukprot:3465059-Rhodomonas_salina.1